MRFFGPNFFFGWPLQGVLARVFFVFVVGQPWQPIFLLIPPNLRPPCTIGKFPTARMLFRTIYFQGYFQSCFKTANVFTVFVDFQVYHWNLLSPQGPLISVLSLIAKHLSNQDFRKQKYWRDSQSKKLSQVLRNTDTFRASLSQFFCLMQFQNVFPCQVSLETTPLLLNLPFQRIKQKKSQFVNAIGGTLVKVELIRNKVISRPNNEITCFQIFQNDYNVKVCLQLKIEFEVRKWLNSQKPFTGKVSPIYVKHFAFSGVCRNLTAGRVSQTGPFMHLSNHIFRRQ